MPSSETQGQIMQARESQNGRKKMATKKNSRARRAPGEKFLPDQFQTSEVLLNSDWCQKFFVFFCPIREVSRP